MKIILLFFLTTTIYCQNVFIRDLAAIDVNNLIAVGDNGLIFKTTDGGKNWYDISIQTDEDFMEVVSFGSKLWLRTYSTDKILYSDDLGINWNEIYQLTDGYISEMFFVNDSTGFMIVPDWDIFKTVNGGKTWNKIPGSYYRAASIFFLDELTGWIGGSNQIYITFDGGKNWTSKGLGTFNSQINAICFLDKMNGYIVSSGSDYYGDQIGIFAGTANNGTSWKYFGEAGFMSDVYFSSPDSGWIISNNRILITHNRGVSWDSTNCNVSYFKFINNKSWGFNGNKILFSDDGWSTWSQQYPKTVSVNDELLFQFYLSQNYPNPFNPVTTIVYNLPYSQNVELIVYDILGNKVNTIINEFQSFGQHKVTFNGKNLSSGVYIYQIKTNNFNQSKKLILLK